MSYGVLLAAGMGRLDGTTHMSDRDCKERLALIRDVAFTHGCVARVLREGAGILGAAQRTGTWTDLQGGDVVFWGPKWALHDAEKAVRARASGEEPPPSVTGNAKFMSGDQEAVSYS